MLHTQVVDMLRVVTSRTREPEAKAQPITHTQREVRSQCRNRLDVFSPSHLHPLLTCPPSTFIFLQPSRMLDHFHYPQSHSLFHCLVRTPRQIAAQCTFTGKSAQLRDHVASITARLLVCEREMERISAVCRTANIVGIIPVPPKAKPVCTLRKG
jgi:hypothetical protein